MAVDCGLAIKDLCDAVDKPLVTTTREIAIDPRVLIINSYFYLFACSLQGVNVPYSG